MLDFEIIIHLLKESFKINPFVVLFIVMLTCYLLWYRHIMTKPIVIKK